MLKVRVILVSLLVSIFMVSCHHPFISVEVRTGGEIAGPYMSPNKAAPACRPPFFACPGYLEVGKVVNIESSASLTFYRIKFADDYRYFSKPPTVVEGTVEEGNNVQITVSDDGIITIKKAT